MGSEAQALQPPHSVEAEQSVLGCLLVDNRAWDEVGGRLDAAAFYVHEHRIIWQALQALLGQHRPADVVTVLDWLMLQGRADEAGGMAYLHQLAASVPSAASVGRYASIVAERAGCRRAVQIAQDLRTAALEARDLRAAIDTAMEALLNLQAGQDDANPRALVDLLPPWVDDLQAREAGQLDAIRTGFVDCDRLFAGGLRRGELVVIGSRPSMGKTALCHALARSFGSQVPTLVCSMEDSLHMMVTRNVAAVGRVNLADLRNPAAARVGIWEGVTHGVQTLGSLQVDVDDQPALTLREVTRKARWVRSRRGDLGVVILDYLQLMEGEGNDESRAYELNRVARGLKRLAKQMNCVVVLLSQLSRKADETDAPPRLDHLAESGGIEQAADIIGLLWREGRRKPRPDNIHAGQIEWAKNKNGACDTVQLWWDGGTQRWESMGVADA